jgi:hypothetical protein
LSVVLFVLSALPAYAAGVRIVRLSLVQGDVQIDRNAGEGWEQAIVNMPVIGGARIYAADNSKAELELEDGSSVRLVGPAQITLLELSAAGDGSTSSIQVDSGVVYANVRLKKHENFRILTSGSEPFVLTQPSHVRFTVDQQVASLSVMQGEAVLQATNNKIRSGETYNYVLAQPESAARQESVPAQPEDTWDQQRNNYNDQYAATGAQPGSDDPNAYGAAADLGAYGTYSDLPGYGVAWQPNDVGPDWNPYDNGAWSYYPDWGWTFVSGYDWGWGPFFYGDWCYIGGRGWWWRPGHGPGPGWHPRPRFTGNPGHGFSAPHPPARTAAHATVAVAGSHLSVGPIAATHAPGAAHGPVAATRAAGSAGVASRGSIGHTANGSTSSGRKGAASNLVRGSAASSARGPSIVGQKGSYSLAGGSSAGRNGYEVHRPPAGYAAMRGSPVQGTPRSYSYVGASSQRSFSGPSTSFQRAPSASSVSSAPHVSGGYSGGSVSHGGGGFSGGGGGHGGGGGGHR